MVQLPKVNEIHRRRLSSSQQVSSTTDDTRPAAQDEESDSSMLVQLLAHASQPGHMTQPRDPRDSPASLLQSNGESQNSVAVARVGGWLLSLIMIFMPRRLGEPAVLVRRRCLCRCCC